MLLMRMFLSGNTGCCYCQCFFVLDVGNVDFLEVVHVIVDILLVACYCGYIDSCCWCCRRDCGY